MRAVRLFSLAALAIAGVTCSEQPLVNRIGIARLPIAPTFAVAPAGGPDIDVAKIRGVLYGTTDSAVATADVQGDSAILEFNNVKVQGDSTPYTLTVQALDTGNTVVFSGEQSLKVKPGDNVPASPNLDYVAPDAVVASIDISVTALALDFAGAVATNTSCLNKAVKVGAVVQQKLTVNGVNSNSVSVPNVHVGWTSRDTSAFTVDSTGLVKSKCANKSAYLVARTFLDKADSILVTVTAPAFSLIMTPDSSSVPRGSTRQLTAKVVDELGNQLTASGVSWFTSDPLLASVSGTGLVTAVATGRVLITAESGGRTTVAVIRVVRDSATKVIVQPAVSLDSMGVGQTRSYFAKALNAGNKVIPEATQFAWASSNPAVFTVGAATGLVTAVSTGTAKLKATIDSKTDSSVSIQVLTSLPPGTVSSVATDASTGAALSGVDVRSSVSNFTTSAGNGSFSLGGLQPGDNIVLSKAGYVSDSVFNVPAFPGKTIQIPTAPLSPVSASKGVLTGTIVNALTGAAVSGVMVKAYLGVNAAPSSQRPGVQAKDSVTTGGTGAYTFPALDAGVYTLSVTATGYSDAAAIANVVGATANNLNDILLPPSTLVGGLFITVTWAACGPANVPCDLDAHLTGPQASTAGASRFQVHSGNKSFVTGSDTVASLDLADSNGGGPEILGIRPAAPAPASPADRYHFYVKNISNPSISSKSLADSSNVRVDVYQDGKLIGTYFPPAGGVGNVWNVFDYDGARLIPVGTMQGTATPNTLALIGAPQESPFTPGETPLLPRYRARRR